MKKINLITIILLSVITGLFAQTPQQFKYQAVLRDASGNITANENVNVNIKILKTSATGTEVFSEDHNGITTTAQGLINLNIGESQDLSTIDWSDDIYFIKISVNGVEMGTSQLLSVPYALNAGNAYWKKNYNDELYFADNMVGIGTDDPAAVLEIQRNDNMTNSQVWIEQIGTGDATAGFDAGGDTYAVGIDNSDGDKFKISHNFNVGNDNILTVKPTGELGIGTTDPTAALHVVGGMKVGATGKQIDEIVEITGTTISGGNSFKVNFPTGYTINNTRVLSLEIFRNGANWRSLGTTDADGTIYTSISSGIWIYYPDNTEYKDRAYRLTLMKVE